MVAITKNGRQAPTSKLPKCGSCRVADTAAAALVPGRVARLFHGAAQAVDHPARVARKAPSPQRGAFRVRVTRRSTRRRDRRRDSPPAGRFTRVDGTRLRGDRHDTNGSSPAHVRIATRTGRTRGDAPKRLSRTRVNGRSTDEETSRVSTPTAPSTRGK